jgi:hypothetical protein
VHDRQRVLDRWFSSGLINLTGNVSSSGPVRQSVDVPAAQHVVVDSSSKQLGLPSDQYGTITRTTMCLLPFSSRLTHIIARGAFLSGGRAFGYQESEFQVELFACYDNG